MRHMIPSFEFRRRAREAMKPVLSVLLLVTLIAMLPSLISQTITLIAGSDPSAAMTELYTEERITAMMSEDAEISAAAAQEILDGVNGFFTQKWPFITLTSAITLIFGPVLLLGYNHTLLKTLRREEITVTTVLARLPLFFKAIGLNLMVALRLLLWMLPGAALSLLGAFVLLFEPVVGVLLMVAAMVVMFVLMIRKMYSYRLSTYVMADVPESGINAAIRRSTEVMKGRRMELFGLELSFIGWRLVLSIGQTLLLVLFGNVLGLTLGMFASFVLQMYVYMAEAAFYQEYAIGPVSFPETGTDDLN